MLAAGAAIRMGEAKQLLRYKGSTLIGHALEQALAAGFDRIAVVLGARAAEIKEAIAGLRVEVVDNDAWETGMGSSLVRGVRYLLGSGCDPDYLAILLADQPLVRAEQLDAMRRVAEESKAPIIAARYGGTLGVPAFFDRTLVAELEGLAPTAGARHLLKQTDREIISFDLPEAALDIDTPEDFRSLGPGSIRA